MVHWIIRDSASGLQFVRLINVHRPIDYAKDRDIETLLVGRHAKNTFLLSRYLSRDHIARTDEHVANLATHR